MATPPRPNRVILGLTLLLIAGAGLAAYLINIPLLWIAAGEAVALGGVAALATRSKPSTELPPPPPEGPPKLN